MTEWTESDEVELVEMVKRGMADREVAQHFGRTITAIRQRRRELGITKNPSREKATEAEYNRLRGLLELSKYDTAQLAARMNRPKSWCKKWAAKWGYSIPRKKVGYVMKVDKNETSEEQKVLNVLRRHHCPVYDVRVVQKPDAPVKFSRKKARYRIGRLEGVYTFDECLAMAEKLSGKKFKVAA